MTAEALPEEDEEARMAHYARMHELVDACMAKYPANQDCWFYKAVALGRESTTQGIMSQVGKAEEIFAVFNKTIELEPTYYSIRGDSNIGSAYYGLGMLYRKIPDSWMISKRRCSLRSAPSPVVYSKLVNRRASIRARRTSSACFGSSKIDSSSS